MPRKAKRSKKGVGASAPTRVSHGTSNLMSQTSSQGHSVAMEAPPPHLLEQTPPEATIAPLDGTTHAPTPPSAPTQQPHATKRHSSYAGNKPPKGTRSKKGVAGSAPTRISHGTSNLMSQASSQGHSMVGEPPSPYLLEPTPPQAPVAQLDGITHASTPLSARTQPPRATKRRSSNAGFMPPKATRSRKGVAASAPTRISHGTSNLMSQASSQGHSMLVEPPPPPYLFEPTPPQAPVAPLDGITHASTPSSAPIQHQQPRATKHRSSNAGFMPPKATRSKKGVAASAPTSISHGTSNLMSQASSQGHSMLAEPPSPYLSVPTPPQAPVAPLDDIAHASIPPSAPTQQPRTTKHRSSNAGFMPPKATRSKKGVAASKPTSISHGTSNLMSQASSSQVHPMLVQPPPPYLFEPTPPQAPVAPLDGITHASTHPSAPTQQPRARKRRSSDAGFMPPEATLSKKGVTASAPTRISHGTSNLMSQASSQVHSMLVEPPPPQAPVAPLDGITHASTPPSAPTQQPRARKRRSSNAGFMPPKATRSKKGVAASAPTRISHGTSNLMSQASSQGHSMLVEPPPPPYLFEPTPPQAPVAPLDGITHATTPPSAPTQQPRARKSRSSNAGYMPHKTKRSKKGVATSPVTRVSHGTPNFMSQASSQGHSMFVEPPPPHLSEPTPPQAPVAPLGSRVNAPTPPSPTQQPHAIEHCSSYAGRESSKLWTVQAIDEQGNQKKIQLTISSVLDMPQGQRIVVPFDRQLRACGEAATLLSRACRCIATDPNNVPINYESWAKVPESCKKSCFNTLKDLFHFQTSELIARRYCYLTMGRKYRNGKLTLWNLNFDPSFSRKQLIDNVPDGVPKDQWSSFVDYRLKPDYRELCKRNAEVRKKQTIPHTGGSKLLSRRQHEMEIEAGRAVGRGELYIATHTKKDGSYVNEEAKSIVEQIEQELCQSNNSTQVSSNDVLAKVLGPDHSGRVRGLGLGGLHSVAFASTTTRFSAIGCNLSSTDSAESSKLKEEVNSLKTKLAASEENVKTLHNVILAYIRMKEGQIPTELGALLETSTTADQGSETEEAISTPQGGSFIS